VVLLSALTVVMASAATASVVVTDTVQGVGPAASATAATDAAPGPATGAPVPPAPQGLARAAVAAAQARAAGPTQLGVAVLDRVTGELEVNDRGDEPFYTASLSKLVVVVDVLDRRRLEGLAVTEEDLALMARALGPSDDGAMSALWDRFDGTGASARVAQRLGITGITAPRRPGQWGEVEVTPAAYAALLRYVLEGMPAGDRERVVADLDAAPDVARDGFDQAFGLLAPAVRRGRGAVAKQGWMCCFSGQYYLHSAGAVGADRRFVTVLLTRVPRAGGPAAARTQLTAVATDAVAALG
jgi:hypothetical protein